MEYRDLEKAKYRIYKNEDSVADKLACIMYITGTFSEFDIEAFHADVCKEAEIRDFLLCEIQVADWDTYLTPWPVENCMKNREFRGSAKALLDEITNEIVPQLQEHAENIYIAGYSLAGLFSLWSLYESDLLSGGACCSSSLWYPGWQQFAEENKLKREGSVYLSLGKAEEKSRHPIIKQVGDCTRKQLEIMQQDENANEVVLKWNDGGHFTETTKRTVAGISWLLSNP